MDPLSDVLSLLRPETSMVRGFDAAGAWAVRFPGHQGIKCFVSVRGGYWLTIKGVVEPTRFEAGDCFLLPRGLPFQIASDPTSTTIDADAVFSTAGDGDVACFNGGGESFGIGAYFAFTGDHARVLLAVLPPVLVLREETQKAALRWSMERLMLEMRERQPGGALVASHLAHLALIEALRHRLAEQGAGGLGWLTALKDKQVGAALNAMHDDPAHPWTLSVLARQVGMSRSVFAQRFKEMVGTAPMKYLARWRMMVAVERLTGSTDSISSIGLSLGYESESAFSSAFKRLMGCSPRQYGRGVADSWPALDRSMPRRHDVDARGAPAFSGKPTMA